MEALGSPITLHAMNPPLTIISGFTPKNAGLHSTRSASFPGSIEPISAANPCVMAGLIVYFATYASPENYRFVPNPRVADRAEPSSCAPFAMCA